MPPMIKGLKLFSCQGYECYAETKEEAHEKLCRLLYDLGQPIPGISQILDVTQKLRKYSDFGHEIPKGCQKFPGLYKTDPNIVLIDPISEMEMPIEPEDIQITGYN